MRWRSHTERVDDAGPTRRRSTRYRAPRPHPWASQACAVAIGRNLREARLAAGLTQAQVADRSGLWRPNVGRLERGDGLPTLESVTRYCAAVGACRLAVLRPLDELQRWL